LAEAENELAALLRAENRVVVAFAHLGEALRTANLLRRVEARIIETGDPLPDEPELLFAVSPARRGFVWRDLGLALLPDTQVFRKRAPRADARIGRALQSFADLRTGDYVVHEDHGIGKLLVCGAVGFGKTEVAVRAAFAVALNGKQALMLVPTTVLAQQHWNTFRERYRDFPVRVEMISRFRSPKEQKQVLADFATGKVDVLIGTHRVLSRDVIPKRSEEHTSELQSR